MNTYERIYNFLIENGAPGESPRLDPEAIKDPSWYSKETKKTFPSVAKRQAGSLPPGVTRRSKPRSGRPSLKTLRARRPK